LFFRIIKIKKMKKTNYRYLRLSVILSLFTIVIFSCNKDQIEIEKSPITPTMQRSIDVKQEFKQKEKIITETISCFDKSGSVIGSPKFEKVYGKATEKKVVYISTDGTHTYVFPLKKENEIEYLFLVNTENELYILEKTASLALKDVANTGISPYITSVFDIEGFLNSTSKFSQVENILHTNFEAKEEENIVVIKENRHIRGNISSTSTGKLNLLCLKAINLMLPHYANFFNLPKEYNDVLFDAIAASHPSGEFCVCPIPTLVGDYLMQNIPDDAVRCGIVVKMLEFANWLDLDNTITQLTPDEQALIADHWGCAYELKSNKQEALAMTINKFGNSPAHNNCADAFRHAFFNAINAIDCGDSVAEQFGTAHESQVPPSQINEKTMDLWNNSIGRGIGVANPDLSLSELADLVCEALEDGNLIVLQDPSDSTSNVVFSDNCSCM